MCSNYDVLKLANGNTSSWEKLIGDNRPRLMRTMAYYKVPKSEAEDIVQNFWAEFWEKRESIPQIKSIDAYIYSSIKYKIISYIRVKKRKLQFLDFINAFGVSTKKYDAHLIAVQKEFMSSLRNFAMSLTERQKEVFFIILSDPELTFVEIGRLLNCSKTNVFKIVKRIRQKFETRYDYKELKDAFSKIK